MLDVNINEFLSSVTSELLLLKLTVLLFVGGASSFTVKVVVEFSDIVSLVLLKSEKSEWIYNFEKLNIY